METMKKKVEKKQSSYDHAKIEKKWQKEWAKKDIYKTVEDPKKPKWYVLDMFPYPSGLGLHVGHPRGYIASDVYARLMRMKGFNVLHPMGYDAFGLPAEQYAIEHKIHPEKAVEENIKTFRRQLEILGFSYDWSRTVNTTDPKYYKWTQWIFLKLYGSWYDKKTQKADSIENLVKIFEKEGNNKINAACDADTKEFSAGEWKSFSKIEQEKILMKYRLAYEGFSEVNWCPELGTVLANDEIIEKDGKQVSERGNYPVEKKSLRQWFLRITAYADRLISGLEELNWSSHLKEIQKNWIGKSVGSEIEFAIKNHTEKIKVFTTRADTLFGVTYVVLAPEVELVQRLLPTVSNRSEVEKYIKEVKNKTDEDRTNATKEKTGVELKGVKAINPANNEEVPVFLADYVLANYGTGMVMAVPAHDERDFAFAKKYHLPMKPVILMKTKSVRSYLIGAESISDGELHDIGVTITLKNTKSGDRSIIIPEEYLKKYENLIIQKMTPGFWNEYIGERIIFIFKNLQGKIERFELNLDTEKNILTLCEEYAKTKFLSIGTMLMDNEFYAPVLLHFAQGILINSGKFDGMNSEEAIQKITEFVGGKIVTKYKMRDAVFARQRYWGEPIPLIHQKDGTIVPVKEKDLPLKLPKVKSYQPIGTGESPLAGVKEWVAKGYETNTMPGWAGSSWYFLRYMDPHNDSEFVGTKANDYWKQVDMYVGGAEHATGHLLYSRFWNKFLYDLGFLASEEPFKTLKNQGMLLGSDNRKMSKRYGNVINPDDVVKNVGADTLRIYECFMGPFDQKIAWNTDSMVGSRRFVERVWKLQEKIADIHAEPDTITMALNQTIKKVGEDIESFSFNTAISSMMILVNTLESEEKISKETYMSFIKLLAPFAPHISEEIWADLGNKKMIVNEAWPAYDESKLQSAKVKIVVQINGKVRATLDVATDASQEAVEKAALADPNIVKWTAGVKILKTIFIKNKIINFVI